jgi:hypothetical protein
MQVTLGGIALSILVAGAAFFFARLEAPTTLTPTSPTAISQISAHQAD